jgi:Ca2+-binding EF-hand superfamily protein
MKEEKLWSAFKYFDSNDTGVITSESAIEALKSNNIVVDETNLNDEFQVMKSQQKQLNFNEFKALIESIKTS